MIGELEFVVGLVWAVPFFFTGRGGKIYIKRFTRGLSMIQDSSIIIGSEVNVLTIYQKEDGLP